MLKGIGNLLKSRSSIYLLAGFYILAGINHFINPGFYYPLIPDYLPNHQLINMLSGILEVVFGIGIAFDNTRKYASVLIMLMLIAFIPSHVYFIVLGSCVEDGLCLPPIIGWLRLLIIHPILIYWAWAVGNSGET